MVDGRNDCQAISRRVVLTGTACALGAAAAAIAVGRAAAQQTISQADAQYQVKPNDGQSCEICFNFQQPNACKFVQGNISRHGWCQLFAPKT